MAGEPTTPLNRQRPISSPFLVRHTQQAETDEQYGRNSVSVRPSRGIRAAVHRTSVLVARDEWGDASTLPPPLWLNSCEGRSIAPPNWSIPGPPSSVYYPITCIVLPYYLQVHSQPLSLSLSLSQRPTHPIANCSAGKFQTLFLSLLHFGGTHFADFRGSRWRGKPLKFWGRKRGKNEFARKRVVTMSYECSCSR
jgi:hypothetical protein